MKKIFFIIASIAIIGLTQTVEAVSIYKGKLYEVWHPDSGFTVFAAEKNGYMDYNSWMIKSTIDDRIYYCIDPALPLEGSKEGSHTYTYEYKEMINSSNLTETKYKKVNLLAYYGYGYKDENVDHTDKKWYGITQVMIWRVMRPDLTWTFKKTRNSTPDINLYKEEIEEMNSLLEKHYITPSFYKDTSSEKLKILVGKETTFIDKNNVISRYIGYNHNNLIQTKIEDNKFTIYSDTNTKGAYISFIINSRTSNNYALLKSNEYQDIIVLGSPVDSIWSIIVEVTGGTLNIQKIDNDTEKPKPKGEATLEGAIYGIYDKDGKLIEKITTNKNGEAKASLEYGEYIIKELMSPKGYNINDNEYKIIISETNNKINLDLPEKVITGKLKLTKLKGGSGEKLTPEENASFDIINSKGEIVEKIKTNEKGLAIKELPYDTYIIHQTNGEKGYIYANDAKIEMHEDKIYELDLQDLKLSKLNFKKLDDITNKPVENTHIKIYKKENDEDILIYEEKTNKNGIININNLEIGNYYIVETKAPDIYKLNEEKKFFSINENGKIKSITMKNERKEGLLKFVKTNEDESKRLKGANIKIYFTETNKLIYKGITNDKGEISIKKLPIGNYCLYETKAPKGYERYKEKTCFKITKENEVVKIIMKNNKNKRIFIPDTLKNKPIIITIISATIIITGIINLVINVKKNN